MTSAATKKRKKEARARRKARREAAKKQHVEAAKKMEEQKISSEETRHATIPPPPPTTAETQLFHAPPSSHAPLELLRGRPIPPSFNQIALCVLVAGLLVTWIVFLTEEHEITIPSPPPVTGAFAPKVTLIEVDLVEETPSVTIEVVEEATVAASALPRAFAPTKVPLRPSEVIDITADERVVAVQRAAFALYMDTPIVEVERAAANIRSGNIPSTFDPPHGSAPYRVAFARLSGGRPSMEALPEFLRTLHSWMAQ